MCRSIKTLRPPYVEQVTDEEMQAAALQYVRKVAGMRAPAKTNTAVFERAVEAVTLATRDLLAELQIAHRPAIDRTATPRPTVERPPRRRPAAG